MIGGKECRLYSRRKGRPFIKQEERKAVYKAGGKVGLIRKGSMSKGRSSLI